MLKAYSAKWNKEHPERARERSRKYYQLHCKWELLGKKAKEQKLAKQRAYYAANKEKFREYRARRIAKNPEAIREYNRNYRREHREHLLALKKKYREEHREEINARQRVAWREKHRDKTQGE